MIKKKIFFTRLTLKIHMLPRIFEVARKYICTKLKVSKGSYHLIYNNFIKCDLCEFILYLFEIMSFMSCLLDFTFGVKAEQTLYLDFIYHWKA